MEKHTKPIQSNLKQFPPVVSVLGHVDHGKTSLLDAIRKSDQAASEAGGITQAVGASEIETSHDGNIRKITFIDTPGHEAFSNMRVYGVNAADIVLLIIASDDGVMPQTRESIKLIKDSNLPFIVVFTKKDLQTSNIEKVRQGLLKEEIMVEELGGKVPSIAVSSKSGEGVKDLLDLILLVYDMSGVKKNDKSSFFGVVIESKLDKRKGVLTSVIVKEGVIKIGDTLFTSSEVGKVRALITTKGEQVREGFPGQALEILGIRSVLTTGSLLSHEKQATSEALVEKQSEVKFIDFKKLLLQEDREKLKIVLKTESTAEIEAIKNALPKDVIIVLEGQGEIGVSDILLAKDFRAIVVGFNVKITKEAQTLAENESVLFRNYKLIYELLDEVSEVLEAFALKGQERKLGEATILAVFDSSVGRVLGVRVREGRLALRDKVKIVRGPKELGKSTISSIKRGKQDVKEAGKGIECGVLLQKGIDFQVGDVLLSYNINT